ncbi:hypothetical protein [uncultured Propionivibrio sp.]|uniref:hypothetical protein n=1 Tax=uncultured Propionivibrio sp. TaxID=426737 RepID=UPI0029C0FDF0|nr:hypothetical protein [uncultured Propionivibrio sp.]
MRNEIHAESMPIELRLAAIIALLSSFSICGVTTGKASALLAHLEALVLSDTDAISASLRQTLEDTLAEWLTIECHPESIAVNWSAVATQARRLQ